MKLTEEEYQVIGDPSERMVQESVFAAVWYADGDEATGNAVVPHLMDFVECSEAEARMLLLDAVAEGEVGFTLRSDASPTYWLDPVTDARMERRRMFWERHHAGSDHFNAHPKNEDWHVRCALRTWAFHHDRSLPNWYELLEAINDLSELNLNPESLAAAHLALNALDGGHIYATGPLSRSRNLRFDVTVTEQGGIGT